MYGLNLKSIRDRYNRGEKLEFKFFYGHLPSSSGKLTTSCFSHWWMQPFVINQTYYCCVEQWLASEKARLFGDEKSYHIIMNSTNPLVMKSRAEAIKNVKKSRENLNLCNLIYQGNFAKFSQNPDLKDFLFATGDEVLVYASPSDAVQGIYMKATNPKCTNPNNWEGENLLGFTLMDVRDVLKEGIAYSSVNSNYSAHMRRCKK